MKPIKRSLKQILNRNKKSIVLSNSLENLLGELKSKHKYVIVDDYDTLMDSLKNISSSFFPDFVNFYKFEDNQNLIDPIYQDNIHIQNDIRPLIYSPPMQRLNHIRQLSFAYLEYKGANHTRFDHSLGVYHLTEKVYKKICENCKLKYSEDELSELLISALFHDIGHSPFSHSIEFILNDLDLNDKLFAKDILLKYYQNFIENDLGLNFNHILMNISPLDDIRKIGEKGVDKLPGMVYRICRTASKFCRLGK